MKIGMAALAAALTVAFGPIASAQPAWPERPIRWIVPFPAGGNADGFTRAIAKHMSGSLGQPIVIENKPGGDTIIGTTALTQAAPDGYTIAFIGDTVAVHVASKRKTSYNIDKDIAPIGQMAIVPFTLIANAKLVPATDLRSFVEYAKANPDAISFGSLGPGSSHELSWRLLQHRAGFRSIIVPYRGLAPAIQDLLAGQIKAMVWGGVISDQFVKTGQIRRIAITSGSRVETAPEATPISELYKGYSYVSWYGLAAPGGTPKPIVERLNTELNKALGSAEVKKLIATYGFLSTTTSPEQLRAIINAEVIRYEELFKEIGVTLPR